MRQLAKVCVWIGISGAVLGGISRLIMIPIVLPSRAWGGFAVILILFAIALAQLYEK